MGEHAGVGVAEAATDEPGEKMEEAEEEEDEDEAEDEDDTAA